MLDRKNDPTRPDAADRHLPNCSVRAQLRGLALVLLSFLLGLLAADVVSHWVQ